MSFKITITPSLEALNSEKKLIALAGNNNGRSIFPKLATFANNLGAYVDHTLSKLSFSFAVETGYSKIVRETNTLNYVAMSKRMMPKPAGMIGTYNEYLKVMEKHSEVLCNIDKDMLIPLEKWIMRSLGDYSFLSRATSFDSVDVPKVDVIRNDIKKVVNFADKTSSAPYGELIKRNGDWPEVVKLLGSIQRDIQKSKPEQIRARVDVVSDKLTVLIKRIDEEKLTEQIPGKTVALIAEMMYKVGEAIEMYSAYCYLISTTVIAIDRTIDTLNDDK